MRVRGTVSCAAALVLWVGGFGAGLAQVQGSAVGEQVSVGHTGLNTVLDRALERWPAGVIDTVKRPGEWSYEEGVLLDGMLAEWRVTGDGRLFAYVKAAVDRSVDENGVIHFAGGAAFPAAEHALDDIEMGRSVLTLYRVTREERYYKAAKFLHDQMQQQPRGASGGYWHKQMYPNQMWLDGAYMAEPFLEAYGKTFDHPKEMDDVATELLLMDTKMETRSSSRPVAGTVRENTSGLLRHGWDESKKTDWSDVKTGLSPEVWSRGMGWYAMAVVDVLERMPANDPQRAALEAVARRVLGAVVRYQDPETGLWWEVMDKGPQKGNYLEASASCMFVYAMAKGIRLGLLSQTNGTNVQRGWEGIEKRFVKADGTLTGTVQSVGLGKPAPDAPYRDGSFGYYTREAVVDDDAKGVGAYLLALSEMTQRKQAGELARKANGKTVLFDAWFNGQTRKTADGNVEMYHYKSTDDAETGYSFWARMFQAYGMRTEALDHAPRAEDLKGVQVYMIASPDNSASNSKVHFMDKASAEAIDAWVKAGGVLVLMGNDVEHADQTYLDLLSDKFNLHFNPIHRNVGEADYADTVVNIPAGAGGIFHHAHKALMKGTCSLTVSGTSKAVVTDKGDTLMAVARAGRGVVFANVDPWLYNEFTDGRKDPLGEDNFAAGLELTRWLVGEAVR